MDEPTAPEPPAGAFLARDASGEFVPADQLTPERPPTAEQQAAAMGIAPGAQPEPIEPNELNVALIRALGLDDDKIGGFRLEVAGGQFPTLQVWWLPPADGTNLTDGWVKPLTAAAADASYVMLPGGDAEAPPVRFRPIIEGNSAAQMYQLLHGLADVLNGASCTPRQREAMTEQARVAAQQYIQQAYADSPGWVPTPEDGA